MTQQERSQLYETLELRGVSRRDFVKFCGSIAAMLGLSEAWIPQIAAAVEQGAKLQPTIWLSQGLCTGCTESVAQSDWPDAATIVLDLLSVNYWETLSATAGTGAEEAIRQTVDAGGYIAVVEGSVMTGFEGNALRIAGEPATDFLKEALEKAAAVIAVGSCAVDGGWVRATPNPAGAQGVMDFLPALGEEGKLVNLPTCPVNPEWVTAIVVDYLLLGKLPELDDVHRPKFLFGQTIHDNCPRRGHFENGEFVEEFGSSEEASGYCLYKVGCKGPQTMTPCPVTRWNRRATWCVDAGSPCIGCGSLNWVDNNAPFFERAANVTLPGVGGVSPTAIGVGLGAVTAAGVLVHGVAQAASGRWGHGAPVEEEQKGGDE